VGGNDNENGKKFVNFTINSIVSLVNSISGKDYIQYKFSSLDYGSIGSFASNSATTNPAQVTKLFFNKQSVSNQDLTALFTKLDTLQNIVIELRNPSDSNNFATFKITNITNYTEYFELDVVLFKSFFSGILNTGTIYSVYFDVKSDIVNNTTITQIRSLAGTLSNNYFYTTDLGREGNWYYDASDTSSADNTGTILVTADGKRIKRIYKDAEIVSWFDSPNNSTDLALFNKIIAASTTKKIIFDKGTFNLQASNANLVSGLTLIMQGSVIQNGNLTGNGAVIESTYEYEALKLSSSGVFGYTSQIYYYKTMQVAKASRHWGGKRIVTGGFWYENDGGGADYTILSHSEANADNIYFNSYWAATNIAGGAGLFVKMTYNTVYAKYTGKSTELDLAFFGVKYDALYQNPADKKYYSDAGYITLATDNYEQVRGAIGQAAFWSIGQVSKSFVLSKTLVINTKLTLQHGAYNFTLRGSGYAEESVISSNVALDVLIENIYSTATPNAQTGFLSIFEDLTFRGNGRVANGMIVKQGHEADGLNILQFHEFTNAGLCLYGVSSTFKVDTITCFENKYGVLITSTHPYRLTDNISSCDGLMSLYKISGDRNTDALIAIDNTVVGGSINIQSVKSENNDNATVLIKKSQETQYISIKNVFTNGQGDFLKIENYVGQLPTIELEGIFQNDFDTNNWDINDLKNSKQIRFAKNPSGAFPHIIYTNNIREYENGFMVYRNGDKSNLESTRSSGTTAQRPTNVIVGYKYYDTTIGRDVIWTGSVWLESLVSKVNIYANDAAADADSTLPIGAYYTLTGSRVTYQKQ